MLKRPKSSEHNRSGQSGFAHGRVKRFHGTASDETIFFFQEATLVACEGSPKQTPDFVRFFSKMTCATGRCVIMYLHIGAAPHLLREILQNPFVTGLAVGLLFGGWLGIGWCLGYRTAMRTVRSGSRPMINKGESRALSKQV
jgi:hypothetical protein